MQEKNNLKGLLMLIPGITVIIACIFAVNIRAAALELDKEALGVLNEALADAELDQGNVSENNALTKKPKINHSAAASAKGLAAGSAVPQAANGASKTLSHNSALDNAEFKDGTYTGSAQGFNGPVTVKVVIRDGKIKSVSIVSNSDTPSYFNRARKLTSSIVSRQSTKVDSVSGATYSSNGIIKATERALMKACGKSSDDTKEKKSETDEWMAKVTEVSVDGTVVEKREAQKQVDVEDSTDKADISEFGIVKRGEGKVASYSLVIPTSVFSKTPKREQSYEVVIKAEGYPETKATVKIMSYGADKLIVRHLDKDGKVLAEKTYTMDEIEKLSDYQKDVLYQGICSHHGIRGFRANGIEIAKLFKDAGIDSYWKSGSEIRLRVNDADTATVNDDDKTDNYMAEGAFSYDFLNQKRYIFTDIYQNENKTLYDKLMELQAQTVVIDGTTRHNYLNEEMRTVLATGKKQEVQPFIATEMYENDLDEPEAPGTNYGTTRANYGFRFFYGIALEEDGTRVVKDETNQRVAYYVYGIDLQDTDEHNIDRTALDAEVQKAWTLKESDYTAESWAGFKTAFDAAKVLVYIEGLNQNIAKHWVTDQAFLDKNLKALQDAEAALVKVEPEKKATTIKVSPLSKKLKAKALKKAKKTFALKATVNSKAKASFKKTSGNKKVTVNKAGKVTVKKGLKKGTYKIQIKVTTPAKGDYEAGTKTVTVKVVVK